MTTFTTDWSASIEHWPDMLKDYAGQPKLRFLEVGCFEGRTSLWLLRNILTHPSARLYVVDPFAMEGQRGRFDQNLMPYIEPRKVRALPGWSGDVLRNRRETFGPFDFVYVDGDHTPPRVLEDAVLAWRYVKPGGMVCFDDYWWPEKDNFQRPTVAVDAFVDCFWPEISTAQRVGADQFLVVKA